MTAFTERSIAKPSIIYGLRGNHLEGDSKLMKKILIISTIILVAILHTTSASAQNILWDNGEWDGSSGEFGERNTDIPDDWTVDDVVFNQDIIINGYRWFSLIDGFDPVGADFIILTDSFTPVLELTDLPFTSTLIGEGFGRPLFQMDITNLNIQLPAGHYYLGGRPVGQGFGRAFTAGNSTILGKTEAYIKAPFFGYPDWVSIVEVEGFQLDIAFAVFGTPAPCLNLTVDNLIAGKNATFTITNGTPGAKAVTVYGTQPGQTIIKNTANYCATFGIKNINQSKIIGGTNRIFGAAGRITFNQKIPPNTSGISVLFQSAMQNTCPDECTSNLVEQIVQ